ncbi:MAG: RNA polymerase sigma factor, partial [Bacteroidota bacterium]
RFKYHSATDEALMAALQKGRQRALAELYDRYNEALRHFFFRMTGQDAERARDFTQDLFVKVSENAARFDTHRNFRTWLYHLAHNMCKNHYRHEAVRRTAQNYFEGAEATLPSAPILAQLDAEIFRTRIDQCLALLDTERRAAFLLRHREGLSLREIADIQQCPLGTVKSRLHHAHRFLAAQLADLKPEILPEDEALR